MTITRSQTSWISESSLVNISTPIRLGGEFTQQGIDLPLGPDVDPTCRIEEQSSTRKPVAIQRAIITFCWLPPLSRRTWPCARVSICKR